MTQVRLDDDVAAELRARAEDSGRSVATVTNAVLRHALGLTTPRVTVERTLDPTKAFDATLRAPGRRSVRRRGMLGR